MLDLLGQKILNWGVPIFFVVFLFVPPALKLKLLYLSLIIFFFILFFLCSYWTAEIYPDKKFLIGFLVSIFHSFIFFIAGSLGLLFSSIFPKIFSLILYFFKETFLPF